MGNRAVLAFGNMDDPNTIGIYLHWNGGRESVEGFLGAARALDIRDPETDTAYAVGRFAQMVGNYFRGTLSLGIDRLCNLDCDNFDNGVYQIGAGWQITGRKFQRGDDEIDLGKSASIMAQCMQLFPVREPA